MFFRAAAQKIAAGILCCCAVSAPAAAAYGIGVQPTTVELVAEPGNQYRQVITVGNVHREEPIKLTVSLADWALDEYGRLILNRPESALKSASGWIRFSPAAMRIEPHSAEEILVDIDVPAKVPEPGDYRTAVVVSTRLPSTQERSGVSGVWNKYQITTLFYITFNPAQAETVLTDARYVGRSPENRAGLELYLANSGNAHARIKGALVLRDRTGKQGAPQPVSTVVLDDAKRVLFVPLGADTILSLDGPLTPNLELINTFNPRSKSRDLPVRIETSLPVIDHSETESTSRLP